MTVDPDPSSNIRRVRQRLADVGPARTRTGGRGDFERVALPAEDSDILRDLISGERARVVIEIGLAYGSSALAIGEALAAQENPHHVIVDAFQDHFDDVGWDALVEAGLERTSTLHAEMSHLALPRLVAEGLVADAAFVDGSHIFHNVFVDLAFLRLLVRPGGLVILDDCEWPSVATAVRYFELNAGWEPVPGEAGSRLRAFRLPDPPVEPNFEDFRPFGTGEATGGSQD